MSVSRRRSFFLPSPILLLRTCSCPCFSVCHSQRESASALAVLCFSGGSRGIHAPEKASCKRAPSGAGLCSSNAENLIYSPSHLQALRSTSDTILKKRSKCQDQ